MTKKSKDTIKKNETEDKPEDKLNDLDSSILSIVKANPEYNNNQIGIELIKAGKVKSVDTVYRHISKNDYLQKEITILRNMIKEDHSRVVFPLARKEMVKALKDKEIHSKDKFPFIKLAYDKELSTKEERESTGNTQVNIESLQMLILNAKPDEFKDDKS